MTQKSGSSTTDDNENTPTVPTMNWDGLSKIVETRAGLGKLERDIADALMLLEQRFSGFQTHNSLRRSFQDKKR